MITRTVCLSLLIVCAPFWAVAPAHANDTKSQPPLGGPPRPFNLPPIERVTLTNGLQVTLVPYGSIPKATVRVELCYGNAFEAADEVWLSDLAGALLREGTTQRSAEALARGFADLGSALSVEVGVDQSHVSADVLSELVPNIVPLLAEVVRAPALPERDLARVKKNLLRRLSVQRAQPSNVAQERFTKLLYGDHPYGRFFPTKEALAGYSVAQIRNHFRKHVHAAGARIYVVGQFDVLKARSAIEAAFGDWARGEVYKTPPAKARTEAIVDIIDRPGALQSTLRLGLPVVLPGHPDHLPLRVMNALLGGAFSSRITANIREQKGYTYSPRSEITGHAAQAAWVQQADVTTKVTGAALTEIFNEIARLRREAPSEKELAAIKSYVAGVFVVSASMRKGLIQQLAFADLHGLGDDYLRTYLNKVRAVTPEVVRDLAARYINPAAMTLVVVGDREKVEAQVRQASETPH